MSVADIPNLRDLLAAVPEEEIERLIEGGKAVKRHFVLNQPPMQFDVFKLRRLNVCKCIINETVSVGAVLICSL